MSSETQTPNRLSKTLSMLNSSLTPSSIQPRKRSSSTIQGNKISIPQSSPITSPIKRQRINAQRIFDSPPNTPTKSRQNKDQDQTQSQSPLKKKLDFQQFITKPNQVLASPPVTPIKSDKEILIPNLSTKNLEFQDDKENQAPKDIINTQKLLKKKSVYAEAKSLFQRGCSMNTTNGCLPEREAESNALSQFLKQNLMMKKSNSLYISGPPGTGKTAQTTLTLSQWINTHQHGVQSAVIDGEKMDIGYTMINCMIVSKTKNIFQDIYKNLTGKSCSSLQNSKLELLNYLSRDCDQMNVIVLDELDKLITSDQQILFELFSWTIFANAKILLIGISNSLDMIDRLLPRLKINGLNPNTLSFLPYTSDQIKKIIIEKLRSLHTLDEIPIIHPAAIQLASKKSSNNTGDLRKAFDICRASIELVEKEVRGGNILQTQHLEYTFQTAPKVKINHVAKVCASVFDNHQSQRLKDMNLQQKFIICMLIKNEITLNQIITMNSLYEYYIKNISVDKLIGVLKKGEFLEVVTTLESIGIVKLIRSTKEYSQVRLSSCLSKKDLKAVVHGVNILEELMFGIV